MENPFPTINDVLFVPKGTDATASWIREIKNRFPYMEEFKCVADRLWRDIEENRNEAITEMMIHPFVSARKRSIQVALKYLIFLGNKVSGKKLDNRSHDLSKLWSNAKKLIIEIGGSSYSEIAGTERMIAKLGSIHGASFAFNYEMGYDGELYLIGIDWKNLRLFNEGTRKTEKYLKCGCMHFKSILNTANRC